MGHSLVSDSEEAQEAALQGSAPNAPPPPPPSLVLRHIGTDIYLRGRPSTLAMRTIIAASREVH